MHRLSTRPLATHSRTHPSQQHEPRSEADDDTQQRPQTAASTKDAWRAAKAWKEADRKARSCARRKVVPGEDVHATREGKSVISKAPVSTKKSKLALDPLRNQRRTQASSTPVKAGTSLGFFKQFHSPEKRDAADEKVDTPQKARQEDIRRLHVASKTRDARIGGATDYQQGSQQAMTACAGAVDANSVWQPVRPNESPQSVHSRRPTWQYGTRKTFEDEIRDVEEAARKNAGNEEEGTSPATNPHKRMRKPREDVDDDAAPEIMSRTAPKVRKAKLALPQRARKMEHTNGAADVAANDDHATARDKDDGGARPPSRPAKQTLPSSKPDPQDPNVSPQPRIEYAYESQHARLIQRILLQRLTGRRPTPLVNIDGEYAKVSTLITQTVTAGESNSILLIGARGSGKTALVDQVIREQQRLHADDFLVVRLNGFIHTDDKLALREIWRQLGREMELDEGDGAAKNYADTLTSLLALLSTPAELSQEPVQAQPDQVPKSVIFVLDEFDLFANHPRQTLLYNLFDIAQSRKAPIAVLGLTTRVDVAESLEKRVKSRFSHRYVHFSLAKNLPAWRDVCRAALSVQVDELKVEEKEQLASSTLHGHDTFDTIAAWNTVVDSLLASDVVTTHLRRLYYTTKSAPDFLTSLLMPLATLPVDIASTNTSVLNHLLATLASSSLTPPDSKLNLLSSLGTLQLALLISAARLSAIHGTDSATFALVYAEYKALASKAKLQASASGALAQGGSAGRVSGKEVAKQAWEDLVESGLVMKGDGRAGGAGRVDVGLEEIGAYAGVDLGGWVRWCKEI